MVIGFEPMNYASEIVCVTHYTTLALRNRLDVLTKGDLFPGARLLFSNFTHIYYSKTNRTGVQYTVLHSLLELLITGGDRDGGFWFTGLLQAKSI